jgi:hypothetical protein
VDAGSIIGMDRFGIKAGVSEAQIDQMRVENPRRILTPCEPY